LNEYLNWLNWNKNLKLNLNSKNYINAREKRRRIDWWIGVLQRLIWPLFIQKLASLLFPYYKHFQNKNQIFHLPNNNNFNSTTIVSHKIFPQFSIWEKKKRWIVFGVCGSTLFLLFILSFFLLGWSKSMVVLSILPLFFYVFGPNIHNFVKKYYFLQN